jgi:hypothetical protein
VALARHTGNVVDLAQRQFVTGDPTPRTVVVQRGGLISVQFDTHDDIEGVEHGGSPFGWEPNLLPVRDACQLAATMCQGC